MTTPEDTALALAGRSPFIRYGTGCVILAPNGEPISQGWSHHGDHRLARYRSVHAELHALSRLRGDLPGGICLIATRSVRTGRQTTARPCQECARLLAARGITIVRATLPGFGWEELDLEDAADLDLKYYGHRVAA